MATIEEQKRKLGQKKARMVLEEAKLKIKEEKIRTQSLIEKSGLITKADLDSLPDNALYGGLLFLKKQIEADENIIGRWIIEGNKQLNKEKKILLLLFSNSQKSLIEILEHLFALMTYALIAFVKNGVVIPEA